MAMRPLQRRPIPVCTRARPPYRSTADVRTARLHTPHQRQEALQRARRRLISPGPMRWNPTNIGRIQGEYDEQVRPSGRLSKPFGEQIAGDQGSGASVILGRFFSSTSSPLPINHRMASERDGLSCSPLRQSSARMMSGIPTERHDRIIDRLAAAQPVAVEQGQRGEATWPRRTSCPVFAHAKFYR